MVEEAEGKAAFPDVEPSTLVARHKRLKKLGSWPHSYQRPAAQLPHQPLPKKCPQCGSKGPFYRDAVRTLRDGSTVQRWLCRTCSHRFSFPQSNVKIHVPGKILEPLQAVDDHHKRLVVPRNRALQESGNGHSLFGAEDITSHNLSSVEKGLYALPLYNRDYRVGAAPRSAKNLDNLNATTNGNVAGESTEAKTEQDVKGKIVELLFQLERNGRKPGTIEGYNKLFRSALKNNVNLLDPEDVKAFLARVKWADSTKANAVAMLEVWFRSLNIRWSQPTYEAEAEIPFLPTEAELDSLISGSGKKMSAYLQLLKETGGRAGEIANLTWTDIDTQQKTVRIKPEKGSYPRILPLTTKALDMVNNLQKYTQKRKQHIFANADDMRANFYTQRKHIAEKLGNPRLLEVHFHTFRHWKGTTEYHKTKDAFWVKEILGHKNILSTQVYIHIEKAKYPKGASDDFFSKVASTKEEIQELLDNGFEYVMQKDGLAFFRKRK